MNNKTKSATEIGERESRSYLQLSFSQAQEANHDALAQFGERFEHWLKKYGVSSKIYYLNNNLIIINRRSDY